MKKLLITVGLLLFAAVFMSGCVTETEDPVVGIWKAEGPIPGLNGVDHESITYVFNADGTGTELWTLPGSHVAAEKYYFVWEMIGSYTYQAVYNDGEVWEFSTVGLGITDGEVTYSKVGYDVLSEYAQKVTA